MSTLETHIPILILWVSTAVAVGAHAASGEPQLGLGLAVVGGTIAWIHGAHRAHSWTEATHDSGRYVVAVLGLYVCFGVLVSLDGSYLFMLFGIFTFTFSYSDIPTRAAVLSAILTAIWIAGWLYHGLPLGAIATPVFVWATANVVNVLSTRIRKQNAERGQLIERLEATREELARAERERGVFEERSRMAREIHDTLAQGFTSVVLLSEATAAQLTSLPADRVSDSLTLIANTARENLDEARRLIAAEEPAILDGRSLDRALAAVGANLEEQAGVAVELDVGTDVSFGGSEDVVLLRIAQEACNNIVKHADAKNVSITLSTTAGFAVLTIIDDGVGIGNATAPLARQSDVLSGGSGLGFMAERAAELDGEVRVEPATNGGTVVEARIPVVEVPR